MKVKNLLSHFPKTVEWSLVAKCAAFVGLALYASVSGGFFAWFFWFIFSVWLFYNENTERRSYKYSYSVFLILVFLYGTSVEDSFFGSIVFFIVVSLLLSIWIGLTRFVFKEKEKMVDIFHSTLSFSIILFSLLFPGVVSALFAGIGIGVLLFELLHVRAFPWKSRILLISVALGLFICELLLVTRALSLHIIVLSGVITLISLVIRNFVIAHFSGLLSKEYLFQNITIFVLLCIVLFATGKWVI